MQEKVNNRIKQILASTKGSQRAKPRAGLLTEIENKIYHNEGTIIPIRRLRLAAVAAAFLLLMNGLAIKTYLKQELPQTEEVETFIMDYKLYE